MNHMIIAVLVLALGYFAFDKFVLVPRRETAKQSPHSNLTSPGPPSTRQIDRRLRKIRHRLARVDPILDPLRDEERASSN